VRLQQLQAMCIEPVARRSLEKPHLPSSYHSHI
jgi:hypothetical protein